ncbi:hypothetical protein GQF42_35265 [Streptomyces broussonetiae]|uniref:Uncharacterized protein n=1 Tax=Streptomyces broussonetiae TaxID=2686304 RepID=A0A6I6NFX6_9ACTN|nr:hypothetical protein [Streptomyces broussonetiae]QHA07855.1 hypothetical protein GQF42_35265 [Streptomyces broussonetiae]
MNKCTTLKGNPCGNPLMEWYGIGPHPGVCRRHATPEQKTASTAALDIPIDIATADPAAVFPEVSITPHRLICHISFGWVAKIRGTNEKYVYARTFLSRSSNQPYGWPLRGNGLYECREIGPHGKFSGFFVIKGMFRRRVQLVTPEQAARMARRMGPQPSE